jgi:hypothetical protein
MADSTRKPRFFELPVVPDPPFDISKLEHIRAGQFPSNAGPQPWLDRPDAPKLIDQRLKNGEITQTQAELCRKWSRDGYLILEEFFSANQLDLAWVAYEMAMVKGELQPPPEKRWEGDTLPGRVLNPHFWVKEIDQLLYDSRMRKLISILLGAPALPFQTIGGHKSSHQLEHSDAIHMTTYPLGYLAATWTAFEDIHPDSGPLVYYPGSHRLSYLLSDNLDIEPTNTGKAPYHEIYEPAIQQVIKESKIPPQHFMARKGDVLIWHANLIHGGTYCNGTAHLSRKALVCHFFAEGAQCYHDLAASPSHIATKSTDAYYRHDGVPGTFDPEQYLRANPDVAAAKSDPLLHYVGWGKREGRPLR